MFPSQIFQSSFFAVSGYIIRQQQNERLLVNNRAHRLNNSYFNRKLNGTHLRNQLKTLGTISNVALICVLSKQTISDFNVKRINSLVVNNSQNGRYGAYINSEWLAILKPIRKHREPEKRLKSFRR